MRESWQLLQRILSLLSSCSLWQKSNYHISKRKKSGYNEHTDMDNRKLMWFRENCRTLRINMTYVKTWLENFHYERLDRDVVSCCVASRHFVYAGQSVAIDRTIFSSYDTFLFFFWKRK